MAFKLPQGKRILHVIDANNWVNRAYFATPVMTTMDGIGTNGVKAFTNMLWKLMRKIRDEQGGEPHIAVCFDIAKSKVFRAEILRQWQKDDPELLDQLFPPNKSKDYKGNRKSDHTMEDLVDQIRICQNIVDAVGLPWFSGADNSLKQPMEADDIIGSICYQVPNCLKIVYSRDGDMTQLLTQQTRIIQQAQANADEIMLTVKNCKSKMGYPAEHKLEIQMLAGDKKDNIPGVPGCGADTAIKLLDRWGSIEGICKAAERGKITGREKRIAHAIAGIPVEPTATDKKKGRTEPFLLPRPDFEITEQLARIRTDVKRLPKKYSQYKQKQPDIKRLKAIKRELEFTNLFWL